MDLYEKIAEKILEYLKEHPLFHYSCEVLHENLDEEDKFHASLCCIVSVEVANWMGLHSEARDAVENKELRATIKNLTSDREKLMVFLERMEEEEQSLDYKEQKEYEDKVRRIVKEDKEIKALIKQGYTREQAWRMINIVGGRTQGNDT